MSGAVTATAARPRSRVPVPTPWLVLAALVVARLALAGWWLAADARVPDIESSRHLGFAWNLHDQMRAGDLVYGFRAGHLYPPFQHLLGAAGMALFGVRPDSMILMQDLVLIPLFAVAVYGIGALSYGRWAGVLAAAVALTAPMSVSVFHMFLIDTPEAVMTAVSVWLVLLSRRFERVGIAALAGLAVGLGMLSKQNFPLFVAGFLLVVFARGGWRHWRGLLAFAVVAAAVSATWYWAELDRTYGLVTGASSDPSVTGAAPEIAPERWTVKNLLWYGANGVNNQLLLPLSLALAGGSVVLLVRWWRDRRTTDYTPELVAGGLVSYVGLTWIYLKDPRYALAALPYMAVLATGWIPVLRGGARRLVAAGVAVVCVINVVGTVWAPAKPLEIVLPGAPEAPSAIGERRLALYKPGGWVTGQPFDDSEILAMMRAAEADGMRRIDFDPGSLEPTFNQGGLDILRRMTGLERASVFGEDWGVTGRDVFMTGRWPGQDTIQERPCALLEQNGRRIYMTRADPKLPFEQWGDYYCPLREPAG